MGKGADLVRAAGEIERALSVFVGEDEKEMVYVYQSSPGLLRAVVGSDKFRNVGASERQKMIWKHLKNNVSEADLHVCWGVYPMDPEEYYEEHSPRSSSSSAYPSVED